MAMVYDPVTTELAFGFEDLYKGGDRDYNDILFSVANSEEDSIKTDATESMVKNTTVLKDLAEANGMVTMFIERYANVNILEDVILYQQDFSTQLNVPFKGHAYVSVETNSQISLNTQVSNLSGYNGLDLPVNWQYSNGSQTYFSNPGASKTVEIITLETTLDDVTKLPAGQKLTGQLIVTIYPLF
jgi:hypothetical protein